MNLTLDERVAAVVGELLSAGPLAARAAKAIIRDQRGLSAGEKRSLTVGPSPVSASRRRGRRA